MSVSITNAQTLITYIFRSILICIQRTIVTDCDLEKKIRTANVELIYNYSLIFKSFKYQEECSISRIPYSLTSYILTKIFRCIQISS